MHGIVGWLAGWLVGCWLVGWFGGREDWWAALPRGLCCREKPPFVSRRSRPANLSEPNQQTSQPANQPTYIPSRMSTPLASASSS